MTLNDEMHDAIKYDMPLVAYTIFWAMQKGLVVGTDNFNKLTGLEMDHDEIAKLIEQDPLNIKPVQLYSMHIVDKLYIFVFSHDETGAKQVYYDLYKRFPKSVGNATSRMDLTMWSKEEGFRTFREIKDATLKFPAVALVYER